MKILKHLLYTIFALFMLYILAITLQHPHKEYYDSHDSYIFSKGNAPEHVRTEIIQLLKKFQDGYTKRDTSQVKSFIQQLFSEENIFILGTMPHEICIGHKEVSRLVFADWYRWGDCTFLIDNANISTNGNVAWISTIGYVKFDLSSLLVLPLRLTAVIVKEKDVWKFQQIQFQFDLDLTFVLVTLILMIIWSMISMIKLVFVTIRFLKQPKK